MKIEIPLFMFMFLLLCPLGFIGTAFRTQLEIAHEVTIISITKRTKPGRNGHNPRHTVIHILRINSRRD